MEECDYCEETFDDEESYLAHLARSHEDELSRLDERRIENADITVRSSRDWLTVLLGAGLVLAGLWYFGVFGSLGILGPSTSGIAAEPLPEQGNKSLLAGVEEYNVTDRRHVEPGTNVSYQHVPPVGGPHYGSVVQPGFYQNPQPYEKLVHNLEHGHVVIYYDPDEITPKAKKSLKAFAKEHSGAWSAVVVVPNPKETPRATYVLTAWNHRLSMGKYDARQVQAFLAEFLGRGPENPVR